LNALENENIILERTNNANNNVEANYFIMVGTSPHTPHLISTSLLVVF